MDFELRKAIVESIRNNPQAQAVILGIDLDQGGIGSISYNPTGVLIDPAAPGFTGSAAPITDEEVVRAYLLVKLTTVWGYPPSPQTIEMERVYKPVGRPTGKGGRIDLLVRRKPKNGKTGSAFLFIEVKAPSSFDSDMRYIDGQLFRLSLQDTPRPRYLVYFTAELKGGELRDRVVLIDTDTFSTFESWDDAGQPMVDTIPTAYGLPPKRRLANVPKISHLYRPLDTETTAETFNSIRAEIHDVIWGGGGTNNNEVFVCITKLILCKIFDETETPPGQVYRFQRLGDAVQPETAADLVNRMNDLYRAAEASLLALPSPSAAPSFDTTRISAEKIAYVVGRLEGLSITDNVHPGDLLGEFFEQIVGQDFTQTKGQFFTPVKLVRFMLYLSAAIEQAQEIMWHGKDHLGRPRLPYVIDPSCGSGTFLIEYMKAIRDRLGTSEVALSLPRRIAEAHKVWFSGSARSTWAREHLFGIENNYDLGLAAKVNMVLHGDGSMNTWILSALLPFKEYFVHGRNLLGVAQSSEDHPYQAQRNEQFDLVLSNPPFSLVLSPDEKHKVKVAFHSLASSQSEALFIERWYQLLKDESIFCCILPEAILDTLTNSVIRVFLLQYFRIRAIVSLPYDTFKPFTSSKTCVVLASKRTAGEALAWKTAWEQIVGEENDLHRDEICARVIRRLGWNDEQVFMAEPSYVGYKRRKNLPDLPMPNELYQENNGGTLARVNKDRPISVLDYYAAGSAVAPSSSLGFWTSLEKIASRKGLRLDPKYRWLWDYQGGVAHGDASKAIPLSDLLEIVDLPKQPKGDLETDTQLIDLEYVESRQAIVREDIPIVGEVGSDKVRFTGCELAVAKLEPYLGKVILNPPQVLGSTEWVGLRRKTDYPLLVMGYLLMLPDMCEAYRRLQSGKRHARLNPSELLDLKIELPNDLDIAKLTLEINQRREEIFKLRRAERELRTSIDSLFR